ncbi:MAG: hypothetical protein FWD13_00640 [Treponema sp.]|nr:hypothetical protein [Treponema sp.]
MKNIKILIILYYILLNVSGCFLLPHNNAPLVSDHITFKIKDVVIGGTNIFNPTNDPNLFNHINMFEFRIGGLTSNPFSPHQFILSEGVQYNNNLRRLELSRRDQLDKYYTYKVNKNIAGVSEENIEINGRLIENILSFNLYNHYQTRFFIKTDDFFDRNIYTFNATNIYPYNLDDGAVKQLILRTNTYNDIVLTYNLSNYPSVLCEVDFSLDNYGISWNYQTNMAFNFNAEFKEILHYRPLFHNYNVNEMTNILFLADGFHNNFFDFGEIREYIQDVDKLIIELRNSGLRSDLNNVNIIRMDSVSIDKNRGIIGVNTNVSSNDVRFKPFGNSDNIIKLLQTSFIGSPLFLNYRNNNYYTNIDLIIIISYAGTNYSYQSNNTSTFLINNTQDRNKDVPMVVMPYNKLRNTISIHLKELLPDLFYDDN